jgi:hypothetical protein
MRQKAMRPENKKLRADIYTTGAWVICMPALAFWPFISAMPAFSLVGETNVSVIVPNALFLLTGFWAALGAIVVYVFVVRRMRTTGMEIKQHFTGLSMGVYATAWLIAYGIYKLA